MGTYYVLETEDCEYCGGRGEWWDSALDIECYCEYCDGLGSTVGSKPLEEAIAPLLARIEALEKKVSEQDQAFRNLSWAVGQ